MPCVCARWRSTYWRGIIDRICSSMSPGIVISESNTSGGIGGRFIKGIVWCVALASLVLSVAIIAYAATNDSGHTSFEPWLLSPAFVASLFAGVPALFFRRTHTPGVVVCIAGVAGLALLYFLDHGNVLVQYDRWIQRGMP